MTKRLLPFFFSICFLGLLYAVVGDFCHQRTKGFALQKIISSNKEIFTQNPLSESELASIQHILNQPFSFMRRGLQCYAFVSQDEKYVLKFFKWSQMEPPFWTCWLPKQLTKKITNEKKIKKLHDLTSYHLAFQELKEETGLVYLHLQKTDFLNTSLCLYDNIKVRHILPADGVEFILQKKVDLFPAYFQKNKENTQELTSFFTAFAELLLKRSHKQITDSDISLEYNMGVLDGKPILFDIGNLKKADLQILSKQEFMKQEAKLTFAWLERNSPMLADFLKKKISDLSEDISSEP